jgi:hypothetical protein
MPVSFPRVMAPPGEPSLQEYNRPVPRDQDSRVHVAPLEALSCWTALVFFGIKIGYAGTQALGGSSNISANGANWMKRQARDEFA